MQNALCNHSKAGRRDRFYNFIRVIVFDSSFSHVRFPLSYMDLSFLHLGGPSYTAFSVGRLVDLRFLIIMANRPGLAQLKNAKHCNLHNGMLLCHHALCNLAAAVQAAVFNVYFFCFCCRYCLLKCSIIVF